MSGDELIASARRAGTAALTIASAVGALVVLGFFTLVLPVPSEVPTASALQLNIPVAIAYLALALVVGSEWGWRLSAARYGWLREGRPASRDDQRRVLRIPLDVLVVPATLWALGAVVFGLLNLHYSHELAFRIAATVVMGGLATCALSYLLIERSQREISARALAGGAPRRPVTPGVMARAVLAWALATGVPLVGIAFVAFGVLKGDTPKNNATAWSVLFLAVAALLVGVAAIVGAARSIAEPIRSVRDGLAAVEAGEQDVEVPVYDASEVGLLQAGFNRMAAGLRERERLRELFGVHVGEDVARRALESGVELGGEVREAAVLFVDVVGSTALASELSPHEVVDSLNRFFAIVLEAVEEHGGWVNKFEGDAALCVFGVPTPEEDSAGRALATARLLAERLEDGPLAAGIGVSAGAVVAGNIGAARRLEYTVIGDPVNEAARLTELAKQRRPRVLASEVALRRASSVEAGHWSVGEEVQLRGRRKPTRLAAPSDLTEPAPVTSYGHDQSDEQGH